MNNRFNPNGIPDYLKARPQWVVWGKRSAQGSDALQKDGRLNKIPFNSRTGKAASSNKPNTWGTFQDAVIAYQTGWYNGVGYMFAEGDGLVGIDLDHCLDATGTPNPQTQDILSHFENTFIEISPSGDGLHIYCFGLALHCGKGQQNKWIEIYGKDVHGKRSNRYFCVTGNQFSKSLEIMDAQAALAWLHNSFKTQTAPPTNPKTKHSTTDSHLEKYVRTAFEDEISKVRNAIDGSRNDQLFKSAAALKELCNSDWASSYISTYEIEAALLTATNLPEKEARSTIASAFKSATGAREKPNDNINSMDNMPAKLPTLSKLPNNSTHVTPSDDSTLSTLSTLSTDDKKSAIVPYADIQSPIPLQRKLDNSPQFPIHALGTLLSNAALAIFDEVQCPLALAAQSVLAAASMACQGIANIQVRQRLVFPLSGYFLSLGETGERKTGVDKLALQAHKYFERQLHVKWRKWEKKPKKDGNQEDDSEEPRQPHLIVEEPTYEGLTKIFQTAQPTVGIFSDEGGRILGGVAMSKDNQIKTLTALSSLWCGGPISRSRAQDSTTKLYDRRLSIHLMVQPKLAMELMLSNENMQDQGFLARFLVCYPKSTIGFRAYKESDPFTESRFGQYWQYMTELLGMYRYNKDGELQIKTLDITPSAKALWIDFYNRVESGMTSGGKYSEIRGFANKATEHAARLAGIIAVTTDPHTIVVDEQYMQWG
ncbi:hypothetical protein PN36_32355 [Candidatus Thiomargarita nelsonii]|uniref:DUF3987 domain-containing protein n=1 Tax=Candidatus Thiomargarita nelsonii TaxID=1003181 RepID=A0A0A6PE21_9GAMM|nr:hypothetical protein PN36_32355 [Candidatus Thiomargarita nelsonii]